MSRLGDLAVQDAYPVDPLVEGGSNVLGGILNATGNVARGLYRDIPRAANWFYEQASKPEAEAQADTRNVMGGLAEQLYTLPKRAIGASQDALTTGTYNPAPAVETALTVMGGGVGGTGKEAGAVVGSGPAKGIRAYHSSPHDFPAEPGYPLGRFDLSKIGTGEGAQAYGPGAYLAESPAVSGQGGQYWKQFANRFGKSSGENTATEYLARADFDREKAAQTLRDLLANPPEYTSGYNKMTQERMRSEALKLLEGKEHIGPRTYEVNINADPAHMLDWDKRFVSPDAMEAFAAKFDAVSPTTRNLLEDWAYKSQKHGRPLPSGEDIVRDLGGVGSGAKQFLHTFREAGIPGIKYLDEGSRGFQRLEDYITRTQANPLRTKADEAKLADAIKEMNEGMAAGGPTRNYVIFDPNIIRIDKKYAVPGAIGAGGMGALAAQDEYRP